MTTLTVASPRRSVLHTAFATLNAFFAGVGEGREIWRRYERLSRMSDAQLQRNGLTRQDLPQVAVRGF